MIVNCQQKDIFKIKDGIPGHGPQITLFRFLSDRVQLACGCSLPISWLPTAERDVVKGLRWAFLRGRKKNDI